jgi:RNA polymerase sigma-70 factor (ECF subfamily)
VNTDGRPSGGLNTSPSDPDDAAQAVAAAAVLPHLDAAFNLARWMTRDEHDAADVVQDAYIRAMRFAGTFRGGGSGGAKAWLLAIVRNAALDHLRARKSHGRQEEIGGDDLDRQVACDAERFDPQAILLRAANAERVRGAIEALPVGLREVVVLREMEELSYKEIAAAISL